MSKKGEWDYDKAEVRGAVASPRAVVSVAFSRSDFEVVALAAEAQSRKVSEFIRSAALERARGDKRTADAEITFNGATSGGVVALENLGGATIVYSKVAKPVENEMDQVTP